jgi:hypothetical protein
MRKFHDRLNTAVRLFTEARAMHGATIVTIRDAVINADHVVDGGSFYYIGLRPKISEPMDLPRVRKTKLRFIRDFYTAPAKTVRPHHLATHPGYENWTTERLTQRSRFEEIITIRKTSIQSITWK